MLDQKPLDEKFFIGIDGGGTKTEFILFMETGKVINKLRLSRSNPNDIGLDKSCELLANGIDMLLRKGQMVSGIFAGIAGCLTGDNGKKIEMFLRERYPQIEIAVDTDGVNVLSCNMDAADCMALICGTGSVLLARENGFRYRIGGWGYLFDEAGSGYDIGRDAISAVLAQTDGMGNDTILTELLKEELQNDIWEVLNAIYEKGKAYIASFAPIVFRAYAMGDKISECILHKNATRLAHLINTAVEKYKCGNDVVVCGGLIENFRDVLVPMIEASLSAPVNFIFPELPPVYGACVECCRRKNITLDNSFYEMFRETYRLREIEK